MSRIYSTLLAGTESLLMLAPVSCKSSCGRRSAYSSCHYMRGWTNVSRIYSALLAGTKLLHMLTPVSYRSSCGRSLRESDPDS